MQSYGSGLDWWLVIDSSSVCVGNILTKGHYSNPYDSKSWTLEHINW